ncbi:MAG: amino acid transporter substrate-binding protein family [Vampirovibrio sp.]|nr:amino acid transporter substrate-binding protein family [Vampirovibrio sp.]
MLIFDRMNPPHYHGASLKLSGMTNQTSSYNFLSGRRVTMSSRSIASGDRFIRHPAPNVNDPLYDAFTKTEWMYRFGKPLNRADAALQKALREGRTKDIPHLLRKGASVNYQDPIGNTPLIEAVLLDNLPAMGILLAHGARTDMMDAFQEGPLFKAASQRNKAAMNILLSADDSIAVDQGPETGETPLSLAASWGDQWLGITQQLLARGANPKSANILGITPMITAAQSNAPQTAQLLYEKDADPNGTDRAGQSVLMHAVKAGNLEVISKLLQLKADPNYRNPKNGDTVIQTAIMADNPDVLRLLLLGKAKIQPEDLDLAQRLEHPAMVELLTTPPVPEQEISTLIDWVKNKLICSKMPASDPSSVSEPSTPEQKE